MSKIFKSKDRKEFNEWKKTVEEKRK